MRGLRLLAVAVMLAGLVNLVIGIVFIAQGTITQGLIKEGLRAEKITTALPEEGEPGYREGNVVDTAKEAEAAANLILEHMRADGVTYSDTPRGSAERASYLDGLTLVTSLNLAVMGFGVSQIALAAGVIMIVTGLALGGTGFAIYRLRERAH